MKPEEIRTQYDRIGEAYVREQERFIRENGDFAGNFLFDSVGDLTGKILLDIGCGDGSHLLGYAERGAFCTHGIDPSKNMRHRAWLKLRHSGFQFSVAQGSAEKTGMDDGWMNVVTSRLSLNYVANLDDAWKEIGRVLKPEGILAFVAPHPFATAQRSRRPYGSKGTFSYELFGSVPVTNYLHTFEDFFSPEFFRRFAVEDFKEFFDVKPRVEGTKGPSAFGVKARRK